MNSFAELVRLRRSMRKFTDELLSPDDVTTLMKSALMSPSSKGKHAWHFVVVDDKDMLEKLSMCKAQGSDFLSGAVMAVVVVCAIHDTMRASISAAYVTRNIVTARSSVNIPVISPLSGKNIPHALKMIRVMTT